MTLSTPVASSDTSYSYYQYNYTGSPTLLQVFLDTDANAASGFSVKGTGANFLIENDSLYRFTGSSSTSWSWALVKKISMAKTSTNVKFTVARSDLNSPSVIDLVGQAFASSTNKMLSSAVRQVLSSVSPSPTPTPTPTPNPAVRDPLKQPFASNSIWNMPIGSGAVYVPANLNPLPGNNTWAGTPGVDDEIIILRPTAPLTDIYYSDAAWTGKNRCAATGSLLMRAPIPSGYVIPHGGGNNSATILSSDGRTLLQTQPLTRCTAGAPATSNWKFANADLYGDGRVGSHGGSHLSAFGGTIRLGELRPGQQGPKHAIKVNVYAKEALFKCSTRTDCFRWPASTADNYAVGWYGSVSNNSNRAMKMGSLLAIPASVNLANLGLETGPAKQLAWTLQNYGAYTVDDAYWAAFEINVETGPDGDFMAQFQNDWGFKFLQYAGDNTPWTRDIQKLMKALYVVDNNSPTSIGGGGTPRQPLAPPIAP